MGFRSRRIRALPKRRETLLSSDTSLIEKFIGCLRTVSDTERCLLRVWRRQLCRCPNDPVFCQRRVVVSEEAEKFYSSLVTVSKELAFDKQLLPKESFGKIWPFASRHL